jgi:LAO/AO transport system kinase
VTGDAPGRGLGSVGLARALTAVEDDPAALPQALAAVGAAPGRAHRVGITGPPGVGKSTLVAALARRWREAGRRVAIVAVDPSSPFSGGALLGDRVRMTALSGDPGVFVRSLASRGAAGGLCAAAQDVADVLDAAGFDPVVFETVGAGQGEVAVVRAADTTVVVLAPGTGDDVQAMKAGLLEAADVLVVNQSDREGADRLAADLRAGVELRAKEPKPAVLLVSASTGDGVPALLDAVDARGADRARDGAFESRRLSRARERIRDEVDRRRAVGYWATRAEPLDRLARDVAEGRSTVAAAADAVERGAPAGVRGGGA